MPDAATHLDRLRRSARGFSSRIQPRHVAAVLAVAVVAAGLAGVRAVALPGPRLVLDSERIRIEVVAPVEPEVTAGPVMEVGDLVNGLVSAPASYVPTEPTDDAYLPDDSFDREVEVTKPRAAPTRYVEEAVVRAPPQPEPVEPDRGERRSVRWFGFDAPERDFRAEREARRARREAQMEREQERERERFDSRRYYSEGPDDRDRTWQERGPPPRREY